MTRGRTKQPKTNVGVVYGYKYKHTVIIGPKGITVPVGKGRSTIASLKLARGRLSRLMGEIDSMIKAEERA
jgi:hypothetical protein